MDTTHHAPAPGYPKATRALLAAHTASTRSQSHPRATPHSLACPVAENRAEHLRRPPHRRQHGTDHLGASSFLLPLTRIHSSPSEFHYLSLTGSSSSVT